MTTSPTTSTTLRTQPAHPFAQRVDSADWEAVTAEVGADGRSVRSMTPGRLGGHRRGRIYGRLDGPSALRAISRGRRRIARFSSASTC